MLNVHLGMRIDDPQNELKYLYEGKIYLYEGKILGNKKTNNLYKHAFPPQTLEKSKNVWENGRWQQLFRYCRFGYTLRWGLDKSRSQNTLSQGIRSCLIINRLSKKDALLMFWNSRTLNGLCFHNGLSLAVNQGGRAQ